MKTKSQMPNTLMDCIHKWGVVRGLLSDNAKAQTSMAVKDLLCQYNIDDMQSELHQQDQNPGERHIQEVKAMTNVMMDRSGAPAYLWLLCMTMCAFIMNWLAHEQLGWLTPISVALGYIPDVSMILCFFFYQKVLYFEYEVPFPRSKE